VGECDPSNARANSFRPSAADAASTGRNKRGSTSICCSTRCLPIKMSDVSIWRRPSTLAETVVEGVMLTAQSDLVKVYPQIWSNNCCGEAAPNHFARTDRSLVLRTAFYVRMNLRCGATGNYGFSLEFTTDGTPHFHRARWICVAALAPCVKREKEVLRKGGNQIEL
jgi:hypothetical protein